MAAVLLRDGRYHDAEVAYRDVIRSDPKNPELYDGLGVALIMQSKVRDSLDPFDRAIKLAPDKGSYRVHRAMARIELGRYPEAEEDLRAADGSTVPEDRFDALVHRGRMRQRQGDYPGAEHEFSGALSHDPKSFDALIGRGLEPRSARKLFRRRRGLPRSGPSAAEERGREPASRPRARQLEEERARPAVPRADSRARSGRGRRGQGPPPARVDARSPTVSCQLSAADPSLAKG